MLTFSGTSALAGYDGDQTGFGYFEMTNRKAQFHFRQFQGGDEIVYRGAKFAWFILVPAIADHAITRPFASMGTLVSRIPIRASISSKDSVPPCRIDAALPL